jgi:putative FmdB family regulatory protein
MRRSAIIKLRSFRDSAESPMPLYEYRCQRCEDVFEVIQRFSDEPLTVHESCGGAVERLLSPPALQFKGTGWYVTDYARAGNGKENGKKDSKPAATAAKDSAAKDSAGKSESKPAATAPPAKSDK